MSTCCVMTEKHMNIINFELYFKKELCLEVLFLLSPSYQDVCVCAHPSAYLCMYMIAHCKE
jgi:hypothetical protein